jgi:hypothetical protein
MKVFSEEEELYSGELEAETNEIEVRGEYANYEIMVMKDGYDSYKKPFSNEELRGCFEAPLMVEFGESGNNTLTIEYSTPDIEPGEENYSEGLGIFTFDADGVPQNYDLVFKMVIEESVEAVRFLLTVTETRSRTTAFEQLVAHDSKMQFFFLDDFDDDVPAFDITSDEYEEWTTTLTWDDSLLLEETNTQDGVFISSEAFEYYDNNTVRASRQSEDEEGAYQNADWFQYDDPNFPLLPTESRVYHNGPPDFIPPDYDYENDPENYKAGPWKEEDSKNIYTPNAKGLLAEKVSQDGNAWASSWTNNSKITWMYDSFGVPTRVDLYEWDGFDWMLFFRFEVTISGNAPTILDADSVEGAIDQWGTRVLVPFF